MAKKDKAVDQVDGTEAVEGEAKGGRAITLTLSDGTTMKRADFIRMRADEGKSRSEIAKELSELQGVTVPYQIVFAATKGHPTYAKAAKVAGEVASEAGEEEVAA